MSELNLFETATSVYLCPVCGSTDLIADILTSVVQEPDGQWKMNMVKAEDIQHEMTNVNTSVRCANTRCGNPFDASGHELTLDENESIIDHWMHKVKGYSTDVSFDSLSEDEQTEYSAWESELYWNTWSGVIADCHTL